MSLEISQFDHQPVQDLSPLVEQPRFAVPDGFEIASVTPEEEMSTTLANAAGITDASVLTDPAMAQLATQKFLMGFGEHATLRPFEVRSEDPNYPDRLAGSYVAVLVPRIGAIATKA